jgi:hypothetical protein
LIDISTNLEVKDLQWDIFSQFNGGKSIIKNDEVMMYISPTGTIYVEGQLYWDYSFDDNSQSVTYSFRDKADWENLWEVKVKVKNLLSE